MNSDEKKSMTKILLTKKFAENVSLKTLYGKMSDCKNIHGKKSYGNGTMGLARKILPKWLILTTLTAKV